MQKLNLEQAVNQIVSTCTTHQQPFVFVVGAGVSAPPVPLAAEIEKHCQEKVGHGLTVKPAAIDRYSYWFRTAYPDPVERQEYLKSLIHNQPISAANFRLAHLLTSKCVANVVVTPNFDEFLSRALRVLGHNSFRVCDHPETVERIDAEATDNQIVHVHGTYQYYDIANLKEEIAKVAKRSRNTAFTMPDLLDRIFVNRSPLVIGYSGWTGDVIMGALERRLKKRLKYAMYWFCYT